MIHYERYMAFHEKWHKELLSGNYEAYDRFRHDYSRLAAYVVDHAFTVWSEHRDKWGLIKEFAANYAKSIETGQDLLFPERVAKWSNHGRLVQNLMVGAQ